MSRQSSYSEHDEHVQFWFNTRTGLVEVGLQSAASYRIGPFATREEAERALEIVRERAKRMREEESEDD